ncbi:hypothetical protein P167DRAFT_132027 [Morchella conica CCBAS932]|uniref:Uncharacterized protein n=2 Tax=Morchella sect. Distantes TaxID=1051054 RepID=A0A3N4KRL5_9PEZI|nr:hypothetical protein P167DRAFT_132027 [Morchella conica CCBAS932]
MDNLKLASCIKKQTQDANSLLHRIHMENVEHIARSKEQEAMRNSLQRNEYIEEQRRAVIEWIYPNNYNDKHEDIFSRRIKDTGNWFLNTPEFKEGLREIHLPGCLWVVESLGLEKHS